MTKFSANGLNIPVKEGLVGSLKVLSNKKHAIMTGLLLLMIIVLVKQAVHGNLRSAMPVSSPKFKYTGSYSDILNEKLPKTLKISEKIIMKMKNVDPDGLIRLIMNRADMNKDGLLDEKELMLWINVRIVDHLDRAIQDNINTFRLHDTNHDGRMSWEEFFIKFMGEQGYSKTKALNLINDQSSLSQTLKEDLAMYKASWSQSEMSEPGYLNINEYLSFLHPEHNHVTLVNLVDEYLTSLDDDADGKISLKEFCNLAYKRDQEVNDEDWKAERTNEFKKFVDIDGNGVIMKKEILMYVDPKNPYKALQEAKKLLKSIDESKDYKLSIEEMLKKKKEIVESKMVDVGKSMHAEY